MIATIFDHPGFTALCDALSVFNPFDVLGLETYELRHTKTLAWLLDPKGSHNLGTAFIARFLDGLPAGAVARLPANLDAARVFSELQVEAGKLRLDDASSPASSDAGGKPGKQRIDVYVQVDATFFLAIEAKIGAGEHGDQLRSYRDAVQAQAAPHASVTSALLYLTLDGAAPARASEAPHWTAIDWRRHVLAPLQALLRAIAPDDAGHAGPNVLHFLDDYLRTLQKVTGSRDYAPRAIAETILAEEHAKGAIGTMLKTLHGKDAPAKADLQLQLKGRKGGQEAARMLQAVEAELRAGVCERIASLVVREGWVRIGAEGKVRNESVESTKIDFMTQPMARLAGAARPHFFFRLDIRRTDTIELKLFFDKPQAFTDEQSCAWPQRALMAWMRDEEWPGVAEDNWNLGQPSGKNGVGQKMAVMTFGGKSATIVRKHPDAEELRAVQDWLVRVVGFVDRKVEEMLGAGVMHLRDDRHAYTYAVS